MTRTPTIPNLAEFHLLGFLEPGETLDRAVAERVYHEEITTRAAWVFKCNIPDHLEAVSCYARNGQPLPRFSRDIRDAFELVHTMDAYGWQFTLKHRMSGAWEAKFARIDGPDEESVEQGKTPAVAICRAALKAQEKLY